MDRFVERPLGSPPMGTGNRRGVNGTHGNRKMNGGTQRGQNRGRGGRGGRRGSRRGGRVRNSMVVWSTGQKNQPKPSSVIRNSTKISKGGRVTSELNISGSNIDSTQTQPLPRGLRPLGTRRVESSIHLSKYEHDKPHIGIEVEEEEIEEPKLNQMQILAQKTAGTRNKLRDYLSENKTSLLKEKDTGGGPTTTGLELVMSEIGGHLLYAVDELVKSMRIIVNKKNKFTTDEATLVTKSVILMKECLKTDSDKKEAPFEFRDESNSAMDKLLQVLSFALVSVGHKLETIKADLLNFKSVTAAFQYCDNVENMAKIMSEIDLSTLGKASDAELLADRDLQSEEKVDPNLQVSSSRLVLMANEKRLFTTLNVRHEEYTSRGVNFVLGVLYITNYRCIFIADRDSTDDREFPIHSIKSVSSAGSRKRGGSGEDSYGIDMVLKDLRTMKFLFDKEIAKRTKEPVLRLVKTRIKEQLRKPPTRYFAFQYKPTNIKFNGWLIYDAVAEYSRMGIPNSAWKITTANKDYSLCSSYPRILAVPSAFSDKDLVEVASFRSRGRIPALSWINKTNKATLTRCSQPKSGVARNTCKEDQILLETIKKATPESSRLRIFDARPKANAVANTAKGAGFEVMGKYKSFSTLSFLGIGNIHVMRESKNKLMDLRHKVNDDKYLVALSDTSWLQHCKLILSNTTRIVETIYRFGDPVLIHCSDGWDRTAQLCSLSMILMDSFYRTLVGFEVLIEKEWLSFGHQFALRLGHDGRDDKDDQRAPIFFQFIFAVYQIMSQFPHAFEFNEEYLLALMHHLYSCLYGTFLFNTEKMRYEHKVQKNTIALWSYLNTQSDFKNPFYKKCDDVLQVKYNMKYLRIWERYVYKEDAASLTSSLTKELIKRDRRIRELEEMLQKSKK